MGEFQKDIYIDHDLMIFPISNGAPKVHLQLVYEGKMVRDFEAELALAGPGDWWAYYDVRALRGKKIRIISQDARLSDSQIEILGQMITQSDDLLFAHDLYNETFRPQFHFTPRRGWSNDPNGLVYADGIWHLFFQWNPFGISWGNMHWGHATSQDLVHWREEPVALFSRSLNDMAFSGSAVVDEANTSEFGILGEEPLVLAFTSTSRGECLAYSLDRGRTFQEYNGNPVFVHNGRDPKIIWFAQQKKWIIIVYDEPAESEPGYSIFESKNLKSWRKTDFLPGWFECPELFELHLENGDPGERLWVIHGCIREKFRSAFQVGNFDGSKFTPLASPLLAHGGPNFYAAQVFNHASGQRKIMLGWLAGADYPGMPFGHGMTVPLELSLRKVNDLTRLIFNPVKELEALRIDSEFFSNLPVDIANETLAKLEHELLDLSFVIDAHQKQPVILNLRDYKIEYNPETRTVNFCGSEVPCQPGEDTLQIRILIDRSVTEVFVDRGWGALASMTVFNHPKPIEIHGVEVIRALDIHTLKSIWTI